MTKDTPVPKAADASIDTKAAATTTPPEDKMVQVDDTGAPGQLTTLVLRVVSSACARSNRAATLMTSNVSCAAVIVCVRWQVRRGHGLTAANSRQHLASPWQTNNAAGPKPRRCV